MVELFIAVSLGLVVAATASGWWSHGAVLLFQFSLAGATLFALARLAWRRPRLGAIALLIGLPLHHLVFGRLFLLGVDLRLLSLARFWKEALLLVLLAKTLTTHRGRVTSVDRGVLAFLALVLLYVVLPYGAPLYAKFLAARVDAAFLVVFLIGRYCPELDASSRTLEAAILWVAVFTAVFAFWNAQSPAGFNEWAQTSGIADYQLAALDVDIPMNTTLMVDGVPGVRVRSIFTNELAYGFYLLIPCGVALGRLVRGVAKPLHAVAACICVAALVLTLVRSALLGLVLMAILGIGFGIRRARIVAVVVIAAAILIPWVRSIPGAQRLSLDNQAAASSNEGHRAGLRASVELLGSHPFGTGLGTAGPLSRRFDDQGFVNESWYFQIGSELGVVGMLLFVTVVLMVGRALALRARDPDVSIGALLGLAGISLAGVVLHSFDNLAVSWTIWLLAGVALRSSDPEGIGSASEIRSGEPAEREAAWRGVAVQGSARL